MKTTEVSTSNCCKLSHSLFRTIVARYQLLRRSSISSVQNCQYKRSLEQIPVATSNVGVCMALFGRRSLQLCAAASPTSVCLLWRTRRLKVEVSYEDICVGVRRIVRHLAMATDHFTIHNLPYGVFSTADNVRGLRIFVYIILIP